MDETVKPLRVPPQISIYADKHNIFHLVQSMLTRLLIDQPEDPINYLISVLQRSSVDVPRVLLLGPPSVGKHTMARRLSAELRAVHVTRDTLLQDQSELSVQARQHTLTEQELPAELLVTLVQRRLSEIDCFNRTFIWPDDDMVAQRLEEGHRPSETQLLAELQRYCCEVTGLSSAYQHVLKIINADQPHADVYQQVLAFVRTRRRSRTPRILLLGPPGSGKSHQAKLLSAKYKMVDVCCGRLLRSVAAAGSTLGEEIQPYLDDGRPVPDSLVLQVLEERLSQLDCSCRGWILHGFPRDLQQARILQESQHQPNRVFFLELTDDVCLERLTLRATDPVSGQRFHAVSRPAPTSEVQNRLKIRPEDSTHTVTHTLSQYRTHTAALQTVYPGAGHIDADQDPHSVFEALESRLTTD
uniref:adenylate kinase 8 isoform X2 n=1 Tax=Epinephelus lanceolatus TaxID=310571 RepID=UPI001447B9B4|nr:adenylate kinase 8 isoform X2 [Epinephelus lanceolatus]